MRPSEAAKNISWQLSSTAFTLYPGTHRIVLVNCVEPSKIGQRSL